MNNLEKPEVDSGAAEDAEEVAHCPRCLTPFEPLQHYCAVCGYAVGNLTPYIPFVNIPFQCGMFQDAWRKAWSDWPTGILRRVFFLTFIGLTVPIMLLGVPFTLYEKAYKRDIG